MILLRRNDAWCGCLGRSGVGIEDHPHNIVCAGNRGLDEQEFSRNLKGSTREYSTGALMPRRLFAGFVLGFFVLMAAAAVTQANKVSEQHSAVSATQMVR